MQKSETLRGGALAPAIGRESLHDLGQRMSALSDSPTGLGGSSNSGSVVPRTTPRTEGFVQGPVRALTPSATVAETDTSQIAGVRDSDVAAPATPVAEIATVAQVNTGVECRDAMTSREELQTRKALRARELRERAGLSQRALAQRASIRREEYNAMECDKRPITEASVIKLAAALDIDPREFYESPSINGNGHA
jgi:DNA-binding XRE family transcriptional regulator